MRASVRVPGPTRPTTTAAAAAAATTTNGAVANGQLTPLASASACGALSHRRLRSALRSLPSEDSERSIDSTALLKIPGTRFTRPLGSAAIRISRQAVVAKASAKASAEASEAGENVSAAAAPSKSSTTTTTIRQVAPRGRAASLGTPQVKPPAGRRASAGKGQGATSREARSRLRTVKGATSANSLLAVPLVPPSSSSEERTSKGAEKEQEEFEGHDFDDFDDFDDDDSKKKRKKKAAPRIPSSEAIAKAAAKKSATWLKNLDAAEIERQRLELEHDRRVKLAARLRGGGGSAGASAPRVTLSAVSARNARARASRSNHDPLARKSFEVYLEKERELEERRKMLSLPERDGKVGEEGTTTRKKKADEERSNYAALADPEREQWWGVEISDPDARKAGSVAKWLEAAPQRLPEYSGTAVEAWVPKKTIKAWSFRANKMGKRVVAFQDGGVVFFKAKMDQVLGDYISKSIIDQTSYDERVALTGRISGYVKSVKFPGFSPTRQVPEPLGDDRDGGGELLAEARAWVEAEEVWDRATTWARENPDGSPMPSLLEELEGRRKADEESGRRDTVEEAEKKAGYEEMVRKSEDAKRAGLDHIGVKAVEKAALSSVQARQATRRAAEAAAETAATAAAAAATAAAGAATAGSTAPASAVGGVVGFGFGVRHEEKEQNKEEGAEEGKEEGQPGFSKRVEEASRLAATTGAAAAGWNVGAPPPSLSDRYYGEGGGRGGGRGGGGRGGRGQGRGFREREYAPRGGARGGRAGGGGFGGGWASSSSSRSGRSGDGGGGGSIGRDYASFDSFSGEYGSGSGDGEDWFGVGGAWGNAAGASDDGFSGFGDGGGSQQRWRSDADAADAVDPGAAAARDFYESDAAAALGGGGDSWASSSSFASEHAAAAATSYDDEDDDDGERGVPYSSKGSFESALESLGLDDDGEGALSVPSSRKKKDSKDESSNEDPASWFDEGLEWE